jgi:riboflavin kinase/FMN adenylyltransferase
MQIISWAQAQRIKFSNLSLALGTFDGLHIGHMALINAVKQGPGESAVFTFDALPVDLFNTAHQSMRLFTLEEKKAAFKLTGIDYLCIAHFDKRFAAIDHHAFPRMLRDVFHPVCLVAGYNYSYGKHAKGNTSTLARDGESLGFEVREIAPVIYDGEPVSSTRIRECLEAGNVERAADLLGYAYTLTGTVGTGRGIGSSKLGYPTANLMAPPEKIVPLRGVYGVDIALDGKMYQGVCNVGVNPTVVSGGRESIEIHILALNQNLYGKTISVSFNKRIRNERKFDSLDALKAQIEQDIQSI